MRWQVADKRGQDGRKAKVEAWEPGITKSQRLRELWPWPGISLEHQRGGILLWGRLETAFFYNHKEQIWSQEAGKLGTDPRWWQTNSPWLLSPPWIFAVMVITHAWACRAKNFGFQVVPITLVVCSSCDIHLKLHMDTCLLYAYNLDPCLPLSWC